MTLEAGRYRASVHAAGFETLIDPQPIADSAQAVEVSNSSRLDPPMPTEILRILARRHLDEIRRVDERFKNAFTASWREMAEQAARGG